MTKVVTGWWKRRFLSSRWKVEYHFVPDAESVPPGRAACGTYVGRKKPRGPVGPWTRGPANVSVGEFCPACVSAIEAQV